MPRFPVTLRLTFGDYYPPPALRAVEGTPMVWTESIADRGESRLISFFRSKPRVVAFLRAVLGASVQDLHDAAFQMLTERWLDTSIGAQLDRIGELVDLSRGGWTDEPYRALLRAQIRVLRSNGRWDDLSDLLDLLGVALSTTHFVEAGTAAATVEIADDVDAGAFGSRPIFGVLARARAAAVRFSFVYPGEATDRESVIAADGDDELSDELGAGDATGDPTGGRAAGVWCTTTTETY
jgi:hypothetical protein